MTGAINTSVIAVWLVNMVYTLRQMTHYLYLVDVAGRFHALIFKYA